MMREREKLRDNYAKNMTFKGDAPQKNSTFLEKVMLELWYEKNGVAPPDPNITNYIPSIHEIGMSPDCQVLLDLILAKKRDV